MSTRLKHVTIKDYYCYYIKVLRTLLKKHGKEINIVLCGAAGDLALQATNTETFLPPQKSPTMLLNALLKMGASIQICPLYLPNSGKTTSDLIEGITVAKPPVVAGRLLDRDCRNLTF